MKAEFFTVTFKAGENGPFSFEPLEVGSELPLVTKRKPKVGKCFPGDKRFVVVEVYPEVCDGIDFPLWKRLFYRKKYYCRAKYIGV